MNDDMPLLTCHYSALSTDGGFISINSQSAMSEYFNFSEILPSSQSFYKVCCEYSDHFFRAFRCVTQLGSLFYPRTFDDKLLASTIKY